MINHNNKESRIIPEHLAFIMDGNRHWARERNLPIFDGHKQGFGKISKAAEWFFSRGVRILSVFAFSTDKWDSAQEEVNYLMKLLKETIEREIENAIVGNYRLIISGRTEELPGDLPHLCSEAVIKTNSGNKGILNICLNYSGRQEIVDAVKKIMKNSVELEQVHEGMIRKYLYNDLPDPNVIVRTSGEKKTSGFLLWGSIESELIFLEKYWPDFEEVDADTVINEYHRRMSGA